MTTTVILCYHRVNEGVADPFHLCVSPQHFAEHLALLGRRATIATLDDVSYRTTRPRVVITFDDGYSDNLNHAAPIAQRLGVPMTVYVTSGMVGDRAGFWWDRLAHLVRTGMSAGTGIVRLPVGDEVMTIGLGEPSAVGQIISDLRSRLLPRPVEEIDQFLSELGERLAIDPVAPTDARPLTSLELDRLSRFDNVTIGAHTTRHVRLLDQPFAIQAETVLNSKLELEAATGSAVRHFAYPFGGIDSFGSPTVAAVRQSGFVTATTTLPGSVGRSPDPLRLRRRLVMNWSARQFQLLMFRWGLL